jgi:hypothetical protein
MQHLILITILIYAKNALRYAIPARSTQPTAEDAHTKVMDTHLKTTTMNVSAAQDTITIAYQKRAKNALRYAIPARSTQPTAKDAPKLELNTQLYHQ